VFIVFFGVFLRLCNINTTYPFDTSYSQGICNDEGVLASNARSKVLFDTWIVDKNSYSTPYFLLPVYNFIVYMTFSIFGVGMVQLRAMHVFIFVLSCLLIHLILKRDNIKPQYILFSLTVYSFSLLNILFGRIGFTENPMVLFMVASVYCYMLSEDRQSYAFLSGILAAMSILTKTYALLIVPVLLIDSLARLVLDFKNAKRRKKHINRTLLFLSGGGILGMLFGIFHFYPHIKEINACIQFEKDPTGTHVPALKNFLFDSSNLFNMGIWHVIYNLLYIPEIVAISCMSLLCFNKEFFNRERIEGKAIILILIATFFILFLSMGYKPPRRVLVLVFPGAILGAYFLDSYVHMRHKKRFIIATSLLSFPVFCLLSRAFRCKYAFFTYINTCEERTFCLAIIVVVVTALCMLAFEKYTKNLPTKKIVMFFCFVLFASNLFSFLHILEISTPWIYNVGHDIGRTMPPRSILVGQEVSSMSLENKTIPYRSLPNDFKKKHYRERIFWDRVPKALKPYKSYQIQEKGINGRLWNVYMAFFEKTPPK